jgi:regulator of sigma E protease
MAFLTTVFYFIVTIFVLVTVHEFGHFIAARIFGMHVPVFSVGMGRRLFGFNKISGLTFKPLPDEIEAQLGKYTDYRLSLLPIGGYAKIDGMIDESTQSAALPPIPEPWEFRAKPWWQKSIVISAGVIMNLLLAAAIFGSIQYTQGKVLRATTTVGDVAANSVAARQGIVAGDKILAVDGKPVTNWDEIEEKVYMEDLARDFTLEIDHNGVTRTVNFSASELGNIADDFTKFKAHFGLLPVGFGSAFIANVTKGMPAEKLGLQTGDIITRVDGEAIDDQGALVEHISSHPSKEIILTWVRNGQDMTAAVTPDKDGHIGIEIHDQPYHAYHGAILREKYSLLTSIGLGFSELNHQVQLLAHGIWMMVVGKVEFSKSVGGPIKIAKMAGQSAAYGGVEFIKFMALLSLSLAFLNILPIPALDGGHLVIIFIEAGIRRELSQKVKMGIQKVGMAVLLSLMLFMVFNDLRSLF